VNLIKKFIQFLSGELKASDKMNVVIYETSLKTKRTIPLRRRYLQNF